MLGMPMNLLGTNVDRVLNEERTSLLLPSPSRDVAAPRLPGLEVKKPSKDLRPQERHQGCGIGAGLGVFSMGGLEDLHLIFGTQWTTGLAFGTGHIGWTCETRMPTQLGGRSSLILKSLRVVDIRDWPLGCPWPVLQPPPLNWLQGDDPESSLLSHGLLSSMNTMNYCTLPVYHQC